MGNELEAAERQRNGRPEEEDTRVCAALQQAFRGSESENDEEDFELDTGYQQFQ